MNRPPESQDSTKADSVGGVSLGYMSGFGNDFETEALPGALPQGMNSPQECNYGLYGERLSRTACDGASNADRKAEMRDNTISFMFETRFPQHLTRFAARQAPLQDDCIDCRADLEKEVRRHDRPEMRHAAGRTLPPPQRTARCP